MPIGDAQSPFPSQWRCPACDYEMTGVSGPICPECGIDAVAEHLRREARRHRPFTNPRPGQIYDQ